MVYTVIEYPILFHYVSFYPTQPLPSTHILSFSYYTYHTPSPASHRPAKFSPYCSHYLLGTCNTGLYYASRQMSRIGQVKMYCVTVFFHLEM